MAIKPNLPVEDSDEIIMLRNAITRQSSGLFDLGGGCLAWLTKQPERVVLLYDPSRVVVEFFVGGGSTVYGSDPEHVHRMVVDSASSKAEYKRSHRSPYLSGRYALEWHGQMIPMEVPFPLYMDEMCVMAWIEDSNLILPHHKSPVPLLEKTLNISDISFISSTLEPKTDKGLEASLSRLVPQSMLTKLIYRMSGAYALRAERSPEKPYQQVI